ncbi:carbon-nitrogen hydrolase [Pseudomassariella vexata]|uniref:nitrilase n=1 Tax=Pseudomassariella vexata TaxID=1141098 RepID=A0A1Y2DJD4_9PEZI|nr:carbon-nitrogen hydrolase [Pseudomassariella vexata]ORY59321.1 carbon-nitrogen hydrolase [Pseudomassariella vexata]
MASSRIRVAVTQAEPVWLDLKATIQKTCKLIKEAAENGAQMVAFPECWVPGYPCWIWTRALDFDLNVQYVKNSLRLTSPEMLMIRSCARENSIAVSMGFSENDDDSLYIAQVLIGSNGEIKLHRRKMKPTHLERTIFGDASAQCLDVVGQLPFARVGQLSCWEHTQPLLKFNAMAQREQIHVAAWPSLTPHSGVEGKDLWSMSAEGCQALSAVYAIEASAFVLHSTALITAEGVKVLGTAGGPLMSSPGGGTSAIFGPDGRRLTQPLGDTEEGILYADLDMDEIVRIKGFAHCTGHYSRPDLMWLGVDRNLKKLVKGAGSASEGLVVEEEEKEKGTDDFVFFERA